MGQSEEGRREEIGAERVKRKSKEGRGRVWKISIERRDKGRERKRTEKKVVRAPPRNFSFYIGHWRMSFVFALSDRPLLYCTMPLVVICSTDADDVVLQAQPSADELTELRGCVLQQVDTNRDGKIELGEFARYTTPLSRVCASVPSPANMSR